MRRWRLQHGGLTPFVQMIWKRMLEAVDFIHSQRVIHSDLKPANFLFVKGELKLIDFGIARSMNSDTTNIQVTGCACSFGTHCRLLFLPVAQLTRTRLQRDNAVGTLNYMCAARASVVS